MRNNQGPFIPALLVLSLFSLLVLAGCGLSSATPIQYDSHTPPEKKCTLNIAGVLTVKKFDDQNVEWQPSFGDLWAMVQIPEGSHTFVLDYSRTGEPGTLQFYSAKGLVVTYDHFVAGHTYLLTAQILGETTIRIGVKDVTNEPDWASLSKAFTWAKGFEWLPVTFSEASGN